MTILLMWKMILQMKYSFINISIKEGREGEKGKRGGGRERGRE